MIRLLLVLLSWAPAIRAAEFQDLIAPDPGHAAIEIGSWYPSNAAPSA